ncbi:MAG: FAD-dependent oxidoreductase, partial [Firmicutes bacterium]|nr:FAD-dependent oxidoreductase [Bacillota bacterium]
ALGVKHRMLGLEGEEDLVGEGISFCAVCDGDFYKGKTVCMAGGGNSALQEAILLAGKCEKVIMLQDLPYFTGESRLQDVLFAHENVETHVNMKITGIKTEGGKICAVTAIDNATGIEADYACDGFFEAIGLIPENDDFKGFADLNQFGYFDSAEDCVTKTPGLFVAGDCRSKFIRQVTTACGDGAVAALAACRYVDLLAK